MAKLQKIGKLIFFRVLTITTLLFSTPPIGFSQFVAGERLSIGDAVPAIDVEQWATDGNGKFSKFTEFEEGNVYVVEFWATWCGPCLRMMPELGDLQEKYGDKVRFLSVTDESPEEVSALMEKTYPNGEERTFKSYMSRYSVGIDPDGSTSLAFLGSGSSSIPNAFVVGQDGKIEFQGHPARLEPVLDKIVAGTWDRDEYQKRAAAEKSLNKRVAQALATEDYGAAFDLAGELANYQSDGNQLAMRFRRSLMAIRLADQRGDAYIKETLDQFTADGGPVAALVWKIVETQEGGDEVSAETLKNAEAAIDQAIEKLPEGDDDEKMIKGATLDIKAHLLFATERLDQAIEVQEAAAKLLDEKEITDFLELLKEKKQASASE